MGSYDLEILNRNQKQRNKKPVKYEKRITCTKMYKKKKKETTTS